MDENQRIWLATRFTRSGNRRHVNERAPRDARLACASIFFFMEGNVGLYVNSVMSKGSPVEQNFSILLFIEKSH